MFKRALPNPILSTPQEEPTACKQLSPMFPPMTMTVEAMMTELNISRKTAYDLVKQDGFPAFRIGSRILVNREGLQRWIDQQCQEHAA